MQQFSKPLTQPPAFLSLASMTVDEPGVTVKKLTQAERPSPPVYDAARQHLVAVLSGKLSYEEALRQAGNVSGEIERTCAVEVLEAGREFFRALSPCRLTQLGSFNCRLDTELWAPVRPLWLQERESQRLLILHLWRTPMNDRQVRAAMAMVQKALELEGSELSGLGVDFISTAVPAGATKRRFQLMTSEAFAPLAGADLDRFVAQFLAAWRSYRQRGPRTYNTRRPGGLL